MHAAIYSQLQRQLRQYKLLAEGHRTDAIQRERQFLSQSNLKTKSRWCEPGVQFCKTEIQYLDYNFELNPGKNKQDTYNPINTYSVNTTGFAGLTDL